MPYKNERAELAKQQFRAIMAMLTEHVERHIDRMAQISNISAPHILEVAMRVTGYCLDMAWRAQRARGTMLNWSRWQDYETEMRLDCASFVIKEKPQRRRRTKLQ